MKRKTKDFKLLKVLFACAVMVGLIPAVASAQGGSEAQIIATSNIDDCVPTAGNVPSLDEEPSLTFSKTLSGVDRNQGSDCWVQLTGGVESAWYTFGNGMYAEGDNYYYRVCFYGAKGETTLAVGDTVSVSIDGTVYTSTEVWPSSDGNYYYFEIYVGPYTVLASHEHSWGSVWASNATHHWHECTATHCPVASNSEKNGYAAHVDGEAVCSVCGYVTRAGATCEDIATPGKYYVDFADALAKGASGVKLLGDKTESFRLSDNKTFTLDVNGFTLTINSWDCIEVEIGCTLKVMDSSADKQGKIASTESYYPAIRNYGTVEVDDVYINRLYNGDSSNYSSQKSASIIIKCGKLDYLANYECGNVVLSGSAEREGFVEKLDNEGSIVDIADYGRVGVLTNSEHYDINYVVGDEKIGATVNVGGTSATAYGKVDTLINGQEGNGHGSVVHMSGYAQISKLEHNNAKSQLTVADGFSGKVSELHLREDLTTTYVLTVENWWDEPLLYNKRGEDKELRDLLINGRLLPEGSDGVNYSDLSKVVAAAVNKDGVIVGYYGDLA